MQSDHVEGTLTPPQPSLVTTNEAKEEMILRMVVEEITKAKKRDKTSLWLILFSFGTGFGAAGISAGQWRNMLVVLVFLVIGFLGVRY